MFSRFDLSDLTNREQERVEWSEGRAPYGCANPGDRLPRCGQDRSTDLLYWSIFDLISRQGDESRPNVDELDRNIVQLLQDDATLSVREIGEAVGLSATPCWRRIRNLEERGVLTKRVTLVDPAKINLGVSALVFIRTNEHNKLWLQKFVDGVSDIPEIIEAYRTSGEVDYVLKVLVPDLAAFDDFYKRLIDKVELYDVRSTFILEAVKHSTSLPLDYV